MVMVTRWMRRAIKEHGMHGGLVHLARRFYPVHINLVFKMDTPIATVAAPQITIIRYSHLFDVDSETLQALTEARGMKLIREFEWFFA